MLEKPGFRDDLIIGCLRREYGLPVARLEFLPLGADPNTAVYRAVTADDTPYFVKLRRGNFDESAVTLPRYLSDRGIDQIIAPLAAQSGQLWAALTPFTMILYPFVEGRDGYEIDLTANHWRELGAALKRIHTTEIPPALKRDIPQETYSPQWREAVRTFLTVVEHQIYRDPIATELAAFLKFKRREILDLVERAERHAATLKTRPPEFVLCHSDLHAGNILIDSDNNLYIVDWDQPIFAPKERDLMYPGGAQGFTGHAPEEEETLFYQGYGHTQVDPVSLAYYRCERIVEDIAAYCEQLLLSDEGGEDRPQSLRYVMSNFEAGGAIEAAYRVY